MEMCLGGRWGTVSDDGWSSPDTVVLCRQLGYQTEGKNHTIKKLNILQ